MKDYSDLITLLRTEDGGGVVDYDAVMEEAADAIEELSEQVKPRMLDGTDYKVTQSVWVGDREVIMAERPKYGEGDKFLCSLYENNGVMGRYTECMVSDDIMEIFDLYVHRILDQMQKVRETISLPEGMDNDLILSGDDRVTADDYKQSIRDKVVVIKPEAISPEYYAATAQVYPYGMTSDDILANKNGVLEGIVADLYDEHMDPDKASIHNAIEGHAGKSREVQPKISAADLEPGKDYTESELLAILKKKPSLSDQIAGASARQASQADNKTQPGHEQGR